MSKQINDRSGLADLQNMQKWGASVWRESFGNHPSDDSAALWNIHKKYESGELDGIRRLDETMTDYTAGLLGIAAAARWVDGGCRTIVTDAKYYAAMAHTKISEDALDELRLPWPAFVVRIPPECAFDGEDNYVAALFWQTTLPRKEEDGAFVLGDSGLGERKPVSYCFMLTDRGKWHQTMHHVGLLSEAFFGDKWSCTGVVVKDDVSKSAGAAFVSCGRAVAGLLYTMQHTTHWRHGGYFDRIGGGSSPTRTGPPPHRTIFIGRPLAVDARPSLRASVASGNGAPPSVQTLVRGHIKRQVVGIGRTGRRVVWIEPYWRGPEDAPILARPYSVGGGA